MSNPATKPRKPVYYGTYLGLDTILGGHEPKTDAHDEHLFITIHQTYELWFKQLLIELDHLLQLMALKPVPERTLPHAVNTLNRMTEILKLLVRQVDVLDTMTALDFLDFRDMLMPASGFQSWQFRLIETRLGLPLSGRVGADMFLTVLAPEHRTLIEQAATQPSLFDLVQQWLERTPYLTGDAFDFWQAYHNAAAAMLDDEAALVENNPHLEGQALARERNRVTQSRADFDSLFAPQAGADRPWRLSDTALKAALMIMLYRDEPVLAGPWRLLEKLVEIDTLLTLWRERHRQMTSRMIGSRVSTGGAAGGGQGYLAAAARNHRIFGDLTQLTTYMLPRRALPALPQSLQARMGYAHG